MLLDCLQMIVSNHELPVLFVLFMMFNTVPSKVQNLSKMRNFGQSFS